MCGAVVWRHCEGVQHSPQCFLFKAHVEVITCYYMASCMGNYLSTALVRREGPSVRCSRCRSKKCAPADRGSDFALRRFLVPSGGHGRSACAGSDSPRCDRSRIPASHSFPYNTKPGANLKQLTALLGGVLREPLSLDLCALSSALLAPSSLYSQYWLSKKVKTKRKAVL